VSVGKIVKEALTIDGPAGQIEALLDAPQGGPDRRVAVLCHPHPQFQGTMLNKVVHTLARAMNDLAIPAIRFNFRGVGASSGEFGGGVGETQDALAVSRWALEKYPSAKLWLCGFSFGGMIAANAALSANPEQLVTIAPAVTRMKGLLGGAQPDCPWLIIHGEEDEVVDCDETVRWVNELSPGPRLILLPEVGHFFHGRLTVLRHTLVANLGPEKDVQ
jgi:alpha/beta superfamily hydrolase